MLMLKQDGWLSQEVTQLEEEGHTNGLEIRMYKMCPTNLLNNNFSCSEYVDEGKCKPEMCQMEANYSGDILAW